MAGNITRAVLCLVLCAVFVPSHSLSATCEDKFNGPYCGENIARCGNAWMHENCALTCGVCTNQYYHPHHTHAQAANYYQWSPWTAWSSCSKSCESGNMRRMRGCPVSLTMCGPGESVQLKPCNTHACPALQPSHGDCHDKVKNCQELKEKEYCMIHMPWMREYCEKTCEFCETTEVNWSPWSECSRSCAGGIRTRHDENCHNYGNCVFDNEPCNTESCEAEWLNWSEWSMCSVSCGQGVQNRNRECSLFGCSGDSSESKSCYLRSCEGSWLSWSSWSDCTTTCNTGTQKRFRGCRDLDLPCSGPSDDVRTCIENPSCSAEWMIWSTWSGCTTTCGFGKHERFRICSVADASCFGPSYENKNCTDNPPCFGEWLQWTSWTECSESCGIGIQNRFRDCTNDNCVGEGTSMKICELKSCEGFWLSWGPWSGCPTTCGSAFQTRYRVCNEPDLPCTGSSFESQNCTENPKCPDVVSPWGGWSECSRSCGEGEMMRIRNCRDIHCIDPLIEIKECKIKECNNEPDWTDWSACTQSCGGGTRTRLDKRCSPTVPDNSNCGYETEACNTEDCVAEYSQWSDWSKCSTTCGSGIMIRNRECIGQVLCDEEELLEKITCMNNDCFAEYSPWSTWTECSQTCGQGVKKRNRTCSLSNCSDVLEQTGNCYPGICPAEYSDWSEWSECSERCGNGLRKKTRTCLSEICDGELVKDEQCYAGSCEEPVYGEWSSWSECSAPCGNERMKQRTRTCVKSCTEETLNELQEASCPEVECPYWSEWSVWSECSVTCGNGVERRSRDCINGNNCEGDDNEVEECEQEECEDKEICEDKMAPSFCKAFATKCDEEVIRKVCKETCNLCSDDCPCEEWSSWSTCTTTCSSGHKTRSRVCENNSTKCSSFDRKICNMQPCIVEPMCLGGEERYGSPVGACCDIDPDEFNTCGNNAAIERVVGGKDAGEKQWPWMVMVVGGKGELCAGTLIAQKWVLTAAHCIDKQDPSGVLLKMGMTDWTKPDDEFVQNRRGERIIIHDKFFMPLNDVGLIEVDSEFEENDYVKIICLPNDEEIKSGTLCHVAGWGMYDNDIIQASDQLQELSLTTKPLDDCKKAYENMTFGAYINDNMICAGGEEGKDTCNGDSGAPLMCQRCSSCSWYLAGVTSFGSAKCGIKGTPGVYTQVRSYEEWIRSNVDIINQNKSFNNTCY